MPGDKSNDSGGIQVHVLEQHKNGHIHMYSNVLLYPWLNTYFVVDEEID